MGEVLDLVKSFFSYCYKRIICNLRHISIFKRLFITSLIIIIIPNLIVIYFSYNEFASEIYSNISSNSYKTLQHIDKDISERLWRYEELTRQLSTNAEIKELLRKCNLLKSKSYLTVMEKKDYETNHNRIGEILTKTSATVPHIANIEIVSPYDEFTQSPDNSASLIHINDIDTFRQSKNYRRSIEAYHLPIWCDTSKESNVFRVDEYVSTHITNYITVLRSIPEFDSNDYLGVIVINVTLEAFNNVFRSSEALREDENIILLSEYGPIQYFFLGSHFCRLDDSNIIQILNLNTQSAVMDISGDDYLVSAVKFDYTDWSICSIIPRKNLLNSVYEIRNLILFVGLICIAFALITSILVNLSITNPVNRLKRAMDNMDVSNLDIIYKDDAHDEIGLLGIKFNAMIDRIDKLINTAYEAELNKKEETIRRKEAELDALQMQINPHFLYNTLDIIRWQVVSQEGGEGKASKMITSFSSLLRLGTKKSNALVLLKEEIEHANAYIEVVQFDLDFDLKVIYNIEESFENYLIPKLTLQPLIENSVIHGFIDKRQQVYKGSIWVHAFRKYDNARDLYIEILDNGNGISEENLTFIIENINGESQHVKGIGLKNINERIRLYFGEEYGIEINSKENYYTRVVLHLPAIEDI